MKMATLAEAERDLDVKAITIRRRAIRGEYPYLMIGTKMMVDLDILRPIVEAERKRNNGINITTLAEKTGLKVSAIRRGIKEGWIPYWMENRRARFDFLKVQDAIIAHMQGTVCRAADKGGEPTQESKE